MLKVKTRKKTISKAAKKKAVKKTGSKTKRRSSAKSIPGPVDLLLDCAVWITTIFKAAVRGPARAFKADNHVKLFSLVFLFALISRLWVPDWYNARQFHPDERWLFDKTSQLSYIEKSDNFPGLKFGEPGSHSNDPAGLQYGSLPLYIVAAFKDLRMAVGSRLGVHDVIKSLGRRVTGFVDALGVLFIFLLGAVLWDRKTGLLAATFVAFTPLNIQLAHFFTVDPYMSTFSVLVLLGCAHLLKKPSWRTSAYTGVALAATLASKSSALPLVGVVILAHALSWFQNRGGEFDRDGHLGRRLFQGLCLAGGATLVAFFFFMPYALLNFTKFYANQTGQSHILVQGSPLGTPYVRQYWDTTPFLFHFKNIFLYYQGLPLALLGFAALAWQLFRLSWALVFSASNSSPLVSKRISGKSKVKTTPGLPAWFDSGMLILLAWLLLYLAIVGWSFAKFARYMLPVTGTLSLIAAATVLRYWPTSGFLRKMAQVALTLVLVLSFGYAAGYVSSYTKPHPWIAASEWIFNNLPKTTRTDGKVRRTRILNESWGDDLPVDITGKGNAGNYHNAKLNIVEWDNLRKLRHFGQRLSWTDLVVMADARAYGTYLKLPYRFPLTHAYFNLMFTSPEKLGFERVAEFHNKIKIFGIEINDTRSPDKKTRWWADESWTLYDRPHTFLFKKKTNSHLSSEEIQQVLKKQVDTLGLSRRWEKGAAPDQLRREALDPKASASAPVRGSSKIRPPPIAAKPNVNIGTSRGLMQSLSWLPGPLMWWLLISVLGWLAMPVAARVFGHFPDGGWALARPLGLLLFTWIAFIVVSKSNIPFYQSSLWGLLVALCVTVTAGIYFKRKSASAWLKGRLRLALWGEAVFLAAFAFFVLLRFFNPHIHDIMTPGYFGGGEPLGMTYLNAVTRCSDFPVYDPWLSLESSSYYYFGYVIAAALTKLSGLPPAITYNLSLAMFFSLTVTAAWGLGLALTRKKRYALVAAAAVACFGTMWTVPHIAKELSRLWSGLEASGPLLQPLKFIFAAPGHAIGSLFTHSYIWDPTRFPGIVSGAIYEFPYFSYLYSDLHPHNMVLPFSLVLLALLLAPFISGKTGWRAFGATAGKFLTWVFLAALFLDAQYAINTWSWPVFLSLGLVTMSAAAWAGRPVSLKQRVLGTGFGLIVWGFAIVLGMFVLMQPFREHFIQGQTKLLTLPVGDRKQPLYQPLAYFFYGLLGLASLASLRLKDWWQRMDKVIHWRKLLEYEWSDVAQDLPEAFMKKAPLIFSVFLGSVAALSLLLLLAIVGPANGHTLFFGLLVMLICFMVFWFKGMDGREAFIWILGFATMAMVAGSELVYVADRMNTVFKFWFNGFMFMSLVFAYAFWRVDEALKNKTPPAGAVFRSKKVLSKKARRRAQREKVKTSLRRAALPAAAGGTILLLLAAAWVDSAAGQTQSYGFSAWVLGLLLLSTLFFTFLNERRARVLWLGVFAALFTLGITYFPGATIARIVDTSQLNQKIRHHGFFKGLSQAPDLMHPTLDGLAFMKKQKGRSFNDYNMYDADLIDWLNTNPQAEKTEVLLETPGTQMYQGYTRFSIYTGLPTLLGWQHQIGQQIGQERSRGMGRRIGDARVIYETTDDARAIRLLNKYKVRWIVVGGLEKRQYRAEGLKKFKRIAKEVRRNQGAVLYRYDPFDEK